MAKKSKTKRKNLQRISRSVLTNPKTLTARLLRRPKTLKSLLALVDNRRYSPDPKRVRDFTGASLNIFPQAVTSPSIMDRSGKTRMLGGVHSSRAFIPHKTAVCVRRKIRREVIMAGTGGGNISRRRPRQTQNSQLICRRK